MAEPIQPNRTSEPAGPPGGGRQDHDVMRSAAMHKIQGPGSTDVVAAIGGLDVPGGEPHPELASRGLGSDHGGDAPGPAPRAEPIPGEYDRTTLTHREPGAVGGQFAGASVPAPDPHAWLDERTAFEHALEGGGDAARKQNDTRHR